MRTDVDITAYLLEMMMENNSCLLDLIPVPRDALETELHTRVEHRYISLEEAQVPHALDYISPYPSAPPLYISILTLGDPLLVSGPARPLTASR